MPNTVLWREIQRHNFTSLKSLADFLELTPTQIKELDLHSLFPLNLPRRLAQKISKRTLDDPIFRQFVPLIDEKIEKVGFSCDPLSEDQARPTPKLLHKYNERALMLPTSGCAMNCRYCFRRHFAYETTNPGFEEELAYIRADTSLREIILSGGDPLSLSNSNLATLFTELEQIPHLRRIRIHTRFPIGIPERIDQELVDILKACSLQIWFVIHCNHPNELDVEVLEALKRVPAPLLCQSVLLRGVNDSIQTLKALFERLVDHGITPYYLYQLDPIAGATHFEVHEERGRALMEELALHLSGYALPKYVREVAGEGSKTPV